MSNPFRYHSVNDLTIGGVIGAIVGIVITIVLSLALFAGPTKNDRWLMDVVRDAAEQCVNGNADMCESWLLYERDTDVRCAVESDETVCSIKR